VTGVDLPTGSGPVHDPALSEDEFVAALGELGYTIGDLVAQDPMYIDVGDEIAFVPPQAVLEVDRVQLSAAAVVVDDVVVVQYIAGNAHCSAPVGGSATLRGTSVDVTMYHGRLKNPDVGEEGCLDVPGDWRATLVVPGAERGMPVGGDGKQEGLTTVAPPLIENLQSALIYPDELPAVESVTGD
jgi:hypothetical protein